MRHNSANNDFLTGVNEKERLLSDRKKLDELLLSHYSHLAKLHNWRNHDVAKADNAELIEKQKTYYNNVIEYFEDKAVDKAVEKTGLLYQDYLQSKMYNLEDVSNLQPITSKKTLNELIDNNPLPDNLTMFRAKLLSSYYDTEENTKYNILHTLIDKLSMLELEEGESLNSNWESAIKYKAYINTVCQSLPAENLRKLLQQKNLAGYTPIELYYKKSSYSKKADHYNVNINGVFLSHTILNYSHEIYFKNDNQFLKQAWSIASIAVLEIFFSFVGRKTNTSTKEAIETTKDIVQTGQMLKNTTDTVKTELDQSTGCNTTGYDEAHKIDLKNKILIGVTGRNNYSWLFGQMSGLDLKKNLKQNSKAFRNINDGIYSQVELKNALSDQGTLTQHEKFIALHVLTRRKFELDVKIAEFESKKGIWGWCVRKYYSKTIVNLIELKTQVEGAHEMLSKHFSKDLSKIALFKSENTVERLLQIKLASYGWVTPEHAIKLEDKSQTAISRFSSTVKSATGWNPKSTVIKGYAYLCGTLSFATQLFVKEKCSNIVKVQSK